MANSNKKHPSDEKNKIDELNESLTHAGTTIVEHKKLIGTIAVGVLIVAALIFGYIFFSGKSKKASAEKFTAVEHTVDKSLEKTENVTDSIYQARLIAEYEKVVKSEGNNTGGKLARVALAGLYYDQKNYKKTLENLQEVGSLSEPVINAQCKILEGDCQVNLNKLPEALQAFEKAAKEAKDYPEVAVRALLKKALVLDAQKKYADALAVYQSIQKDYAPYAQELAQTSAQGGSETAFSIEAFIAREEARLGK